MSKWIIIFISEDSIYFLYVHTEGISDIFKCIELYMQIKLRSHAIFIPLYCDINLFTSSFIRMYRNWHPVCKPIWSHPMFEMYQNVNLKTTDFIFMMNVWVSYLIMTQLFFEVDFTLMSFELLVTITGIFFF